MKILLFIYLLIRTVFYNIPALVLLFIIELDSKVRKIDFNLHFRKYKRDFRNRGQMIWLFFKSFVV